MVIIRAFVVQTLLNTPAIQSGVGARVWPRESMTGQVTSWPYIVVGMGNATAEDLSEDPQDFDMEPERQFFQVWVHDKLTTQGGSYMGIDELIPMVKAALRGKSSKEHSVIDIKYLETSGEFSNEALNTLFRYIRFQAIRGKVTQ